MTYPIISRGLVISVLVMLVEMFEKLESTAHSVYTRSSVGIVYQTNNWIRIEILSVRYRYRYNVFFFDEIVFRESLLRLGKTIVEVRKPSSASKFVTLSSDYSRPDTL